MRATTFLSGLFLTTAVLAAPTPRPQDHDITYDDPFHISKRIDLPAGVPAGLPDTSAVTTEVESATSKLGLKLPTRDELSAVTDALSVDAIKSKIEAATGKLPVRGLGDDYTTVLPTTTTVTTMVEDATSKLPMKVPSLPVRDLSSVTDLLSPVLDLVKGLLSELLSDLESADSKITTLENDLESGADDLVSSIEADLSSGFSEVQSLVKTLEKDGNSGLSEAKALVSQVETLGGKIVADLEALQSEIPSVASLVTMGQKIVSTVQGLGL